MNLNKILDYIKQSYAKVVAYFKARYAKESDAFLPGKPVEVLTQPCTDAEGNNITSTDQTAVKVDLTVGAEITQDQRNKEVRKRRYYNNAPTSKSGTANKGAVAKKKNR